MTTIRIWSGREIRALREARRMSQRDFAAHLGISERMVSKWEAGGENIIPRPVNQSALDTSLAASGPEVHERFGRKLDLTPAAVPAPRRTDAHPGTDSDPSSAVEVGDEEHV